MIRKTYRHAVCALALWASPVASDGVNNGSVIGHDGIYSGQAIGGANGISSPSVTAAPPPTGCSGTIDLSTGCIQPMLGGL